MTTLRYPDHAVPLGYTIAGRLFRALTGLALMPVGKCSFGRSLFP